MKHIVLVHGACHGAWCWYKLVCLLRKAGHRVTALDLGGCGLNTGTRRDITTIDGYVKPLMDFMRSIDPIHDEEKVILVGHNFGGIAISLAMENFPKKILVAVFVSGYMPSCSSPPLTLIHETFKRIPMEEFLDTTFWFDYGPDEMATHAVFGPEMLATKLYQNCHPEDVELAKMLVKPNGLFSEDLASNRLFTKERFGKVKRVFVMCGEDELVKTNFQKWIIQGSPPNQVKFIPTADHMAMLSRPQELCLCLEEIIVDYQ